MSQASAVSSGQVGMGSDMGAAPFGESLVTDDAKSSACSGSPLAKRITSVPGRPEPRLVYGVPFVRRAKAPIFSGCNSHPATVAPAGSNRSGSGGNETAEASDAKGR